MSVYIIMNIDTRYLKFHEFYAFTLIIVFIFVNTG